MNSLEAIQSLIDAERQKREADLLNSEKMLNIIKALDEKFEIKIDAINPKSQYRLLSIKDVESLIPFKSKWIDERVADGSFPRPKIIGSKKIWYQKDIEKWIQENMSKIEH